MLIHPLAERLRALGLAAMAYRDLVVPLQVKLVESQSLAKLRGTLLPIAEVLSIGLQIAKALAAAHAHGIIHGAITPTNILVTPRRSIRLCDFATPPGQATPRTHEEDVLAHLRLGPYSASERCGEPKMRNPWPLICGTRPD